MSYTNNKYKFHRIPQPITKVFACIYYLKQKKMGAIEAPTNLKRGTIYRQNAY